MVQGKISTLIIVQHSSCSESQIWKPKMGKTWNMIKLYFLLKNIRLPIFLKNWPLCPPPPSFVTSFIHVAELFEISDLSQSSGASGCSISDFLADDECDLTQTAATNASEIESGRVTVKVKRKRKLQIFKFPSQQKSVKPLKRSQLKNVELKTGYTSPEIPSTQEVTSPDRKRNKLGKILTKSSSINYFQCEVMYWPDGSWGWENRFYGISIC